MQQETIAREMDACAIIAFIDKRGKSSHANIVKTIEALQKMGHRSGDINGEGDGCGIMTDIPRDVWARRLAEYGLSPHLAESGGFFVGHFLLPPTLRGEAETIISGLRGLFRNEGVDLLMELKGMTRDEELGPLARAEAPLFWQVAGMVSATNRQAAQKHLFEMQVRIETMVPEMHIASLSLDSAVYKLRGLPELLPRVYPELLDGDNQSVITLGHSRYSTNTLPTVERAQPFSVLGHNGEINTIERLRSTGRVLGIEPVPGGSDSQDLNRIVDGLINLFGLEPLEAIEMVFPAIHSEVKYYPQELQSLYSFYRWFFPCSAQGPAAVVARYTDVCVGSVDALGLRPLWFGENDYEYFLSSEKGVVDLENTLGDPRPLAPGEKVAIVAAKGKRAEVLDYGDFQRRLLIYIAGRKKSLECLRSLYSRIPKAFREQDRQVSFSDFTTDSRESFAEGRVENNLGLLSALGWQQYDLEIRKKVAVYGREVIGSMGYQGPLASLCPEALPNIPEFFKENVAVVTNPAIDRERESEHFTTKMILGNRPDIAGKKMPLPIGLELRNPLLLGGLGCPGLSYGNACREVAGRCGVYLIEELLHFFTGQQRDPSRVRILDATFVPDSGLRPGLEALCEQGAEAVERGALLLLLDDSKAFREDRVFIDPSLALASLIRFLEGRGLRRECSLIVRSAAVRNLHDIMFLVGLGADAVNPYFLWRVACEMADESRPAEQLLFNTVEVLQKGIEKCMSTMGIHELCGYGRIFASIGLATELEEVFRIPNFCGSKQTGLSFATLEHMSKERYARATADRDLKLYAEPARNVRVGKVLRKVAVGNKGYLEMATDLEKVDREMPIALRHALDIKQAPADQHLAMDDVDISIAAHSMPIVIAAMSFGSQGERSFRAYAEAALKTNIICMNGEGGEIPDMLGKYRKNRGQQIASGRFGVFMGLLNSADVLEIKIGQGAKPGEGGHLPGTKVTEMVARARHCKPGITLISPSNQHDIYSIEDLAQIIMELKTANPFARISVKIPVTSGVGTIAVGIAKAGADIVNISGYEGGTGAAREHSKRYVGLPVEIGVTQAHRALLESGLRDKVEIWCDGGLRSGADVLKAILLGANRAGLGTVALMGVGCISCRRCHLDRCPRGISTQIQTKEEADSRGLKGFAPRQTDIETENLARLLTAIGDEIRSRVAALGERKLQTLVGRTDLLEQMRFKERLNAHEILEKPHVIRQPGADVRTDVVRKPLNYLTKLISDLVMERFEQGQTTVNFAEDGVRSTDRAVGTYLAGAMTREYRGPTDKHAIIRLRRSVPGNGLCAFTI
jgi:glutamate synthase (NADPH/NADH) large chain